MSTNDRSMSHQPQQVTNNEASSPAGSEKQQFVDARFNENHPMPSDTTASHAQTLPTLPILPSQLAESYGNLLPPLHLYSDDIPSITTVQLGITNPSATSGYAPGPDGSSFTEFANDLVNDMMGRIPSGGSVVEPNSVLGESGRLYHGYKDGKYFLPNDSHRSTLSVGVIITYTKFYVKAEQDRLDLQHKLYCQVLDNWLAISPLASPPKYVLDVGTGTGIWASEFDLSAIQPRPRFPNLEFIRADAEDEWIFSTPHRDHENCSEQTGTSMHPIAFDYVHWRMMMTCFNSHFDVMKHAFANMSPGGWIEFQDVWPKYYQANPQYEGNALQRWGEGCIKGAAQTGRDIECVLRYDGWLKEAGFINITRKIFLVPIGEWHNDLKMKKMGFYIQHDVLQALQGVWKLLRNANMTPEEIQDLIDQVRHELHDPENHSYCLL
ncbi:S-adenosyl-L-methionine-dependent methyltransferase [Xylariales sp. PMI_506]|nr:S-adenosyl-L-methionine-dependent methyltransferase [Xylariales sp. PMI_506]